MFDQVFEDLGTCSEAVDWELDFRQLAPGKLGARVSAIGTPAIEIVRFSFDRPFHQQGSSPIDRLVFGFPDSESAPITQCGEQTQAGYMLNLNLSNGLDSVSGAGFIGYAVALRNEDFERVTRQLGLDQPSEQMMHSTPQWRSPEAAQIGAQLRLLFEAAERDSRPLTEFNELISCEITTAVATILGSQPVGAERASPSYRAKVLRKSLDILREQDQLPISVSELCSRVGASSATLNRFFCSEYGLSPKAYIRSRCLSAVRDELRCTERESRISDIANKWGFWHMGQFARDFRKQFGELPSELLARQVI